MILALLSTSGCGSYPHRGGSRHTSSGGGEAIALGVGILAGAAIASTLERSPPPEPAVGPRVIYVFTGPLPTPPPALPASPRDRVTAPDVLPRFDPIAARSELSAVDVTTCPTPGAPRGYGHAIVTFNPDGIVSKVLIDEPSDLPPATVQCVGDLIGAARVSPFRGSLVNVGTVFRM